MEPQDILHDAYIRASNSLSAPIIENDVILQRVWLVCRHKPRAAVRALMACLLAKAHHPEVDIRKPYTNISGADTYSGRYYDEQYLGRFVIEYNLPVISTTGFLTPAYRTKNILLTPDVNLGGRGGSQQVYEAMLWLLTDVHEAQATAFDLLTETIRQLLLLRDENRQRMNDLMAALEAAKGDVPLSAEDIVTLISQHLASKGTSRLPVLVVAAAYNAVEDKLGEKVLPLEAHNAADSQTAALGDIQISLTSDDNVVTVYEMKDKRVTTEDIDLAVQKIADRGREIDNYIFITTDLITAEVVEYAKGFYNRIGIEIVVLDCIGFLRHFLHLFHRLRMRFLDEYQNLVLNESESAVSHTLKETFLALRRAAEEPTGE